MTPNSIGVCSWSIDRHDAIAAIRRAGELGFPVIQVGFFTTEALHSAKSIRIAQALRDAGRSLAGVFLAFEGEDYSSVSRIAETGGFAPDDLAESRMELVRRAVALTASLNTRSLAIHAATIPVDAASPLYRKLLDRVGRAADIAEASGLNLSLESGREPMDALLTFIDALRRPNLAINFDPANLVMYGVDEPAKTVMKLKGRIDGVHLKDAKRSERPGVMLGTVAPIGTGDAEIPRVISKLRIIGYDGPLLIEVKGGENLQPLRDAGAYLRTLLG